MNLLLASQHLNKTKTAEKVSDLVHKVSENRTKPLSKLDKYSSVEFS